LSSNRLAYKVDAQESDRLDKFLAQKLPDYSRSRLQALIKESAVMVNQQIVTKTGFVVEHGNIVEMILPENVSSELMPEKIDLDVIFENSDLAVINKPAGMVVHPAAGHDSGTLVHAALARFTDLQGIGGELRPGVVHRLDKETSGLIVIAKNETALRWLQEQFKSRKVEKIYIALVDGKPPTPTGRVEAAIARDPSHRKKMAVVSEMKGRASVTEYKTLETFREHTLIEAHPLTGRTHQIRLHLAFLKCPITGDTVYGRSHPSVDIHRHFLHAAKLKITLPGEKTPRFFEAPLPVELEAVLDSIR
jgi:23S rRNA pseudouridine1911/1915/1917 synthase